MLAASAMLGNSGEGGGATATEARDSGGGGGEAVGVAGTSSGGFSEEDKLRMEESDRNSGGNRWPRQETLALLQIRSDMDVAFRDSSLKGPLWDEVSRKLAELGFHRSAKKCKEKFENVYKYHRRTKEGRSTKPDGKTYRFFDQLQALENQAPPSVLSPQPPPLPPQPQSQPVTSATPVAVAMPATTTHPTNHPPVVTHVFTVPSMANPNPTTIVSQNTINPPPSSINPFQAALPPPVVASPISFSYQTAINPPSGVKFPVDMGSISTSSSTSSDDEPERGGRRKRKWGDFFQRLMTEVIEKQEDMQKKFLETLDRRERERVAREEAWRAQEMARMNREHELLVHERSVAAAKDAAVIQFLQKISDQQIIPNAPQMQMQENNPAPQPPKPTPPQQQHQPQLLHPPVVVLHPPPQPQPQQVLQPTLTPPQAHQPQVQTTPVKGMEIAKTDNGGGGGGGGESFTPTSSSRWPKAEVEALIRLRTNMDTKYQENVPKGPLWEEISAAMRRIGYDRNAKRCKEKWENINKYFKKVKESNKKRPEDSKTCPYFQQLDELYKEKAKNENNNNINSSSTGFNAGINVFGVKPENIAAAPIMVQPEQQYRPEDDGSQDIEDEGEDEDDDDDDEAGGYEVVPNKASNSVGTAV